MKRLLAALTVAALGVFGVPAVAAAQTGVRTIPASVASDCSKDVTSAVQGFVSAGGTMQFQSGGCYQVNAKLTFNGKLDMRGSTIRKTKQEPDSPDSACGKHAGFIELKSGGQIANGRLERVGGPGGYSECHYAEHGIEVRGSSGTAINNITMSRIRGDCLYLQRVDGVLGKDIDCESNGRQGGAISAGRNVKLYGYTVRNSSRSGWDFESNGTDADDGIYNFVMDGFDFTSNLIAFPSQGYNSPQDGITIRNGIVRDSLSFIYDRQVRPTQDNCRGSVQRKNWVVENVVVAPTVSGAGYGGKGLAVFCGTQNVRVSRLTMPGGEVVFEGSSGNLTVVDSCVKGVRAVTPTTPGQITQTNVKAPPCAGVPPPPSTKPPTSTKPPVDPTLPATSAPPPTQPPVTTPPTVPPTVPPAVPCLIIRRTPLRSVDGTLQADGSCRPVP